MGGLGWIVLGVALYVVYRRRVVHERLRDNAEGAARLRARARTRVPAPARPRPVRAGLDDALDVAASLSASGGGITAVTVLEVLLDLPLNAELPEEEDLANRELDEARAIGDSYGVTVIPRLIRAPAPVRRSCGRPSGGPPRSS